MLFSRSISSCSISTSSWSPSFSVLLESFVDCWLESDVFGVIGQLLVELLDSVVVLFHISWIDDAFCCWSEVIGGSVGEDGWLSSSDM